MQIHLYDTLSRNVRPLKTIEPNKASIYSCGPTVYNNLHIGNLSAFIYADILRRTISHQKLAVTHVMNITDVDDKTIRDSKIAYPNESPHNALQKLTTKYTQIFLKDMAAIGNDVQPLHIISAVDSIQDMILLTQKLLNNDMAYIAEDGVYFAIKNYVDAGNTYGIFQHIDVNTAQSRIANDEYDKNGASDFALWKKESAGEPSWPATFKHDGKNIEIPGRPGWHIECSAMSEKVLGVPFDIHTGGIDLKFPHHENEIAQTVGSGKSELANQFIHNGHIMVDGRKMSKSLNNFYTLLDVMDKGFTPLAFRVLTLESHYRSESNFSWEILEAAQNRLNDLQSWADLQFQDFTSKKLVADYEIAMQNLEAEMANDLNTPGALSVISGMEKHVEELGADSNAIGKAVSLIDELLGFSLSARKDITNNQKQILEQRKQARKAKDWAKSDELRDVLKAQEIAVRDASYGQVWYRTN